MKKKKFTEKCLISFNSMKNQNYVWRGEGERGPKDPGWHLQDPNKPPPGEKQLVLRTHHIHPEILRKWHGHLAKASICPGPGFPA